LALEKVFQAEGTTYVWRTFVIFGAFHFLNTLSVFELIVPNQLHFPKVDSRTAARRQTHGQGSANQTHWPRQDSEMRLQCFRPSVVDVVVTLHLVWDSAQVVQVASTVPDSDVALPLVAVVIEIELGGYQAGESEHSGGCGRSSRPVWAA
jgi:hypothetical protein